MADDRPPLAAPLPSRHGGRPSREDAERLGERILDVATTLFLTEGYGATSIEAVAKRARISKRTFYHRFSGKPGLFGAVVHRLVGRIRPANDAALFQGGTLEQILEQIALAMVRAALSPSALALNRVILAEATRFPELAAAVDQHGARREAITRIGALLGQASAAAGLSVEDPSFAAEQFMQMIVSVPQRRALGLGRPMTDDELADWARKSVALFLRGVHGVRSGR